MSKDPPSVQATPRKRWLRFSIRFLLLLLLISSVSVAWIVQRRDALKFEEQIVSRLMDLGVKFEIEVPKKNWIELATRTQLQHSRYRVTLGQYQNDFLYDLGKLNYVEGLNFDTDDHFMVNLIAFDGLTNLKDLTVGELYSIRSFVGVQSLTKLESLTIDGPENWELIHLKALKGHPSLKRVCIDGWELDPQFDFQVLPE